ncbi:MAG: hypothetical protein R3F02_19695 [Thiolinea sp.]
MNIKKIRGIADPYTLGFILVLTTFTAVMGIDKKQKAEAQAQETHIQQDAQAQSSAIKPADHPVRQ